MSEKEGKMTIEAFVTATVHPCKDGKGQYIQIRFTGPDGRCFTSINPKGVEDCQWVKRIAKQGACSGQARVESKWPLRITFSNPIVAGADIVEAELAPRWTFEARTMRYRDGKADCLLELSKSPRLIMDLGDGWDIDCDSQDGQFKCVQIGNHKSESSHMMVEAVVSILLDKFPSEAKEYHVVRFYPKDWDILANLVFDGCSVVLRNSRVAYNKTDKETIIDTIEHWDYANADGSIEGTECGVFKRYIGGWVEACDLIEISFRVDFKNEGGFPTKLLLPKFNDLLEEDKKKMRGRRMKRLIHREEDDGEFDEFPDNCYDEPDWKEESGWNDLYGEDVEPSDIIEFRD